MKYRSIFYGLTYGLVVALLVTPQASATVLTDQQITAIQQHCGSIRTSVQRTEQADKVLRVNLGQYYETAIMRRLMLPMNARLASNGINSGQLGAITDTYQKQLDTYRTNHSTYMTSLLKLENMDCAGDPVGFYNLLDQTRTQRSQVYASTQALNATVKSYQDEFAKVASTLGPSGSTQ